MAAGPGSRDGSRRAARRRFMGARRRSRLRRPGLVVSHPVRGRARTRGRGGLASPGRRRHCVRGVSQRSARPRRRFDVRLLSTGGVRAAARAGRRQRAGDLLPRAGATPRPPPAPSCPVAHPPGCGGQPSLLSHDAAWSGSRIVAGSGLCWSLEADPGRAIARSDRRVGAVARPAGRRGRDAVGARAFADRARRRVAGRTRGAARRPERDAPVLATPHLGGWRLRAGGRARRPRRGALVAAHPRRPRSARRQSADCSWCRGDCGPGRPGRVSLSAVCWRSRARRDSAGGQRRPGVRSGSGVDTGGSRPRPARGDCSSTWCSTRSCAPG